jgi:DHA2 family multidrug resistance protein
MRPAQVGSRAIPVAGHGVAIREARVAQGTGPPSGTDAAPVAAVSLSLFVVNELVVEKPLLRLRLHTQRNFGLGTVAAIFIGFALFVVPSPLIARNGTGLE